MTREEIMALAPSRKLDALIAQTYFCPVAVIVWEGGEPLICWYEGDDTYDRVQNYSTDIAAAWSLVEELRSQGWYFTMKNGVCLQPLQAIWEAEVFEGELMVADAVGQCVAYRQEVARATTAPLAICRVALLANLQPA